MIPTYLIAAREDVRLRSLAVFLFGIVRRALTRPTASSAWSSWASHLSAIILGAHAACPSILPDMSSDPFADLASSTETFAKEFREFMTRNPRPAPDLPLRRKRRASHSQVTGAPTHRVTSSPRRTSQLRLVLTTFSASLTSSALATPCSLPTPSLAAPSRRPRSAVT
jgi:hypothetical protein